MSDLYLNNLKTMRLDKGWTQDVVSELSGVSSRTLQRIESGGKTSIETAKSLASVFELESYKKLSSTAPSANPNVNTSTPSQCEVEQSNNQQEAIPPLDASDKLSWWDKNIEYSLSGILTFTAIIIFSIFARYLLPESLYEGEALPVQFIVLFTFAFFFVLARKLMQGVGIWDDVCYLFRTHHSEPIDPYLTVNWLSNLIIAILLGLCGYSLYFNGLHLLFISNLA